MIDLSSYNNIDLFVLTLLCYQPIVTAGFQTEPWWVHERGHNDVLKGNEHEFFRRMAGFLDTVKKQQQQPQKQPQKELQSSVHFGSNNNKKESVRAAEESTVKADGSLLTPPTAQSNEILLSMDLSAPRRI